jgi:hypothetical protein
MGWKMVDYDCIECGTFEALEKDPVPVVVGCPQCDGPSERLISCKLQVHSGVNMVSVTRGKPDEPGQGDFSTRHIAKEWA